MFLRPKKKYYFSGVKNHKNLNISFIKKMSEIEKNKNDEIDLIQLFNSIGNRISKLVSGTFNGIIKILLSFIYFGLRNFIAISVIFVISLVLFFFKGSFTEDVFQSNMKVKTTSVPQQDVISYINKLGELTEKENKPVLQEQLGIDSITASKITNIGAFWHIDTDGDGIGDYVDIQKSYFKTADDSITRRITSHFNIHVEYKEGLDISQIEKKLLDYVNNNPFFIKANEIRKRQIAETYKLTKDELGKLDTTRVKYNDAIFENMQLPEARNGQLVFLNGDAAKLQEVKLYQSEIFSLDAKGQDLIRQLELTPDIVTVLEGLTLSNKPATSFLSLSRYSILFFILGLASIILFENRKKIIELKKQSSLK